MGSPGVSPQRKDTIKNQDTNRIINEQDPIIPPLLSKYLTGYKPLFNDTNYPNKTEDDLNDSTYNSHTEIDEYLNKLNVNSDEDKNYEYKDENSQALNMNESVTNKLNHKKHWLIA